MHARTWWRKQDDLEFVTRSWDDPDLDRPYPFSEILEWIVRLDMTHPCASGHVDEILIAANMLNDPVLLDTIIKRVAKRSDASVTTLRENAAKWKREYDEWHALKARKAAFGDAWSGASPFGAAPAYDGEAGPQAPPRAEPLGPEEREIIDSVGMRDWHRDGSDAESVASSNFAFFLAMCLDLYPAYDEFTERVTFRRLRGEKVVSDEELEQWNANTEKAILAIYALATDRRKPWGRVNYSPALKNVGDWLDVLAFKRRHNAMTDRLKAWEAWDGKSRLRDWLARYTGHRPEDVDHGFVCAVGEFWLTGFIARAETPGVKFDLTPAIAGIGGSAKTGMLRGVANTVAGPTSPDAFLESAHLKFDNSAGHNRVAIATRGKLIVELAEARNLRGHDAESLKAVLTPIADDGRGINGKSSYRKMRQFSTCITVNGVTPGKNGGEVAAELARIQDVGARDKKVREYMAIADFSFLQDPTGNRRIAVVKTLKYEVDLKALRAELPQLVAEARARASELGLKDCEMVMPLALRAMIGERESDNMAASDMVSRLQDEMAEFVGEPDLIVPFKTMREHMQLKTRMERDQLQTAFVRLGFKHQRGTGNQVWYVRGEKTKAKHVVMEGLYGKASKLELGKDFGQGQRASDPF